MSKQRFITLVLAALVIIAAALYLSSRRNASQETAGVPLLPALAGDLNAATAVLIRKGSPKPTLTLHKVGEHWSVAERNDYPADLSKLRKLLTALRDARIVEEKTADPARFAAIGVEDPGAAAAPGAEVTVVTPTAKAAVIVGKSVGSGNFVRRDGENRSFSVEPAISVETEPRFWIDPQLIDVPVALIQSIEVKPATGAAYTLHRLNPADNTFSLDGVPTGRKPLDGHALAPSASLLSALNAEDVAPAAEQDFAAASRVTVTQSDGGVLTLLGTVKADKHWIEASSTKDAALSAKAKDRAFEIASYRYDAIFKPLEQLLEPAPVKTPAKIPAKTPAAVPTHSTAKQPAAPPR